MSQISYNELLNRINKRENRRILYSLAGFALVFVAIIVVSFFLINQQQDVRQSASTPTSTVTLNSGKLFVNGIPFTIRGVNYNPTYIGDSVLDTSAPPVDVPKIAALGANTVATYFIGRADFDQWHDITTGENFYNSLYPAAESNNLKLILGYFSNNRVNWTDTTQVTRLTKQYQDMVNAAKSRPSTLIYMIGNEVFEKLGDEAQKVAYAKWIGQMTDWTHTNDPLHPVMYSDIANYTALLYLKQYASNIDIYGVNHYEFASSSDLSNLFSKDQNLWPGKPLMLHEWGSDAYNVNTKTVDNTAQAVRIPFLAQIIDAVVPNYPVIGATLFEYSDEWRFVGNASSQDSDSGWTCSSCFDGKANEDYWGLTTAATNGQAIQRVFKPSYYSLQQYWLGANLSPTLSQSPTNIPSPTITTAATPTRVPTSTPTITNTQSVSISGIKTTDKTRNSITLKWNTSVPTTSLIIYGTSQTNLSNASSDNNFSTSHSMTLTNLSTNTKYFYRIFATSAFNIQASSSIKNFTTAR